MIEKRQPQPLISLCETHAQCNTIEGGKKIQPNRL